MKPNPLQAEALEWMGTHKKGLLPLPVGQGKTGLALMFLEKLGEPAIVVSTKHIIERTWPDEILKWGFPFSYASCCGPKKIREAAVAFRPMILGVSFENLKWYYEQHDLVPRRVIFIDESSKMKDRGASRVEAQKRNAGQFHFAYALTGTPAPESAMDMWAQFACLMKERPAGNLGEYRANFFNAVRSGDDTHTDYHIRPDGLQKISKCYRPYFFKPSPEKISDFGIPAPRHLEIKIPWISEDDFKLYETMAKEMCLFDGAEYNFEDLLIADSAGILQNKLRQMASGFMYKDEEVSLFDWYADKTNALNHYVERLAGEPLLCFAQYDEELIQIEANFPNAQFGLPDNLDDWNSRSIPLMVLHPKSASHGLNLQEGSHNILFYSLPWGGQDFDQSVGRLQRMGQRHQVTIARFIREGTIEARMFTEIQRKSRDQIATVNALGEGENV